MFYYNYVRLIFSSLVGALPLLLVWLGGAGFAIARWKQHPRVSRLALVGFLILIVNVILDSAWFALFTRLEINQPESTQFVYAADMAANLVFLALRLTGFILVVLAIFQGRTELAPVKPLKTEEAVS